MSTSLLTLQRSISKEPALGYASGTVSADTGLTNVVEDTYNNSPLYDTANDQTLYQNAWVKIEVDVPTVPGNLGEVRRIQTYTPSTGRLTVSRAFSAAPVGGQVYGIYFRVPPTRMGIHKGLDEYINETLRNLYYRTHHLVTLVTDGDMETSGVTNWGTISGSPDVSKTTTSGYVWMGDQALYIKGNTVASSGVHAGTIAVTPGQIYILSGMYKGVSSSYTGRLQLYDDDNAVEIESKTATDISWRLLVLEATIPSTCHHVRVRLIGDEAGSSMYWDNVCLRSRDATTFDLPTWIANPQAVEGVESWYGGTAHDDGYAADELRRYESAWWRVVDDPSGLVPYRLEVAPRPYPYAQLFVRAIRPGTELLADTDTTDLNADLVKAGVLCRIFADMDDGPDKAKGLAKWIPTYSALLARYQPRINKRFRVPEY